jgi:hypothetical protein
VSDTRRESARSGSSWTGPQTLHTNPVTTIGPASPAGASSTTSSIGYAALLNTSGMTKSVILAKFDGSTVSTYTVASGIYVYLVVTADGTSSRVGKLSVIR